MNKKVATIILNRNLPKPTDQLYEHLIKYDKDQTDIYVLEAGSEPDNLSQYCTWHVRRDKEIMKHGLRYSRGMNYALLNLFNEKKWDNYEGFLITNDTEFKSEKTIKPLISILEQHKNVGIVSPCSKIGVKNFYLKKKKQNTFGLFIITRIYLEDSLLSQ